ncbi:formimidoylglutamate deiminase [Brevibacterium gallinarum]|uniref:Formimidoylglutamate deiminase n=1 Tax=Brevibacterium gallinarum TaxID=2762220 RepID=A0ABR8WU84_9MICO|nr:formimidoylglutamate deiminase [Brevibacterium gallinarum]MBD8020635.1 formimidoylglutamate deiminase [Brevibacterium gallinarum]
MTRSLHFEAAWLAPGRYARDVRVSIDDTGIITAIEEGADPGAAAGPEVNQKLAGFAIPGAVNAHSHAFHRLLRGRTHGDGGTFWTWREVMYRVAGQLDPENYYRAARAIYAEMVTAGYTAVGEFHYVHYAPGGTPYAEPHAMERALAQAACDAGIRLVLLDTCYLTGAIGEELGAEQQRFGDGTIDGYLQRHTALAETLAADFPAHVTGGVTLGAAIHSVRAVPAAALPAFTALDGPLHVHLSEQPAENDACRMAYGKTPTQLLADAGVVTDRLSAVHATHLTDADIELLGQAASTIVMCPTTEADLADGIGPARALADAGAVISLGSDQHVTLDPLLELRGLEAGERLGSGQRGRFSPAELLAALTSGGSRSLHLGDSNAAATTASGAGLATGQPADIAVIAADTPRTYGSAGEQIMLAGTAADVTHVFSAGRLVAEHGVHASLGPVGELYREAYRAFDFGD